MSTPAAWHPDPTGRHEYRYWDGQQWTEHVANGGVAAIDPLPGTPADAQQQAAAASQQGQSPATSSAAAESGADANEAAAQQQPDTGQATPSSTATGDGSTSAGESEVAAGSAPVDAGDADAGGTGQQPSDTQSGDSPSPDQTAATDQTGGDQSAVGLPSDTDMAGARDASATTSTSGKSGLLQDISRQPAYAADAGPNGSPPAEAASTERSGSNASAVIALVVGVLSMLLAVVPFIGLIGVLGGIVALVLGIVGRKKAKELLVGKSAAMAGIITGALAIVFGIASTAFVVLFLMPTADFAAMAECVRQSGDPQACADLFEARIMQRFGLG
ncbi:MAG: DUF2510 domain-containing protein [Nitriliruptoraceae bacterium]